VTIVKYEWEMLFLDYSIGCPVSFTDKYTIQDIQILNSKSCHFLIYCYYYYYCKLYRGWCVMVFNATFINISVISRRSVFWWRKLGVPGENHRPAASHWQTLSHNVVSSTPRYYKCSGVRTHNVSDVRHGLQSY